MSERITINLQAIKPRQTEQVVAVLIRGGLIAYPTDSGYAFGWRAESRQAREQVIRLRRLDNSHHFTFCCRNLSDVGRLTRVSNPAHRMIRELTPGPYTFILPATARVPRPIRHKQETVGVRIPDHPFVKALLDALDEPLLSSSLILPETEILDSEDLFEALHGQVDLFVDAGACALEPTTLLDLCGEHPRVLRRGAGVIDFL